MATAQGYPQTDIPDHSDIYFETAADQAVIFSGKIHQPLTRTMESLYMRNRFTRNLYDNGKEVVPKPVPVLESYAVGYLKYDGVLYPEVSMRLDLVRDRLVIQTPNQTHGIILIPERVEYAFFNGYGVIYMAEDTLSNIPAGYYAELYGGEHSVLKKEGYLYDDLNQLFKIRYLRFYLKKDGTYHRVRGRRGPLLKQLGGHRKELLRFIRQNNIVVSGDTETAIVRIVEEYERLNRESGL